MRSIARWCLVSAAVGLWACTGPQGPPGPKGDPGVQGQPGPSESINGLDGGTVRGDSQILGNFTVTGSLTAGGTVLTYGRQPLVLAGVVPNGCAILPAAGSGLYHGTVVFPVRFPANPVVAVTIDETNDDYGATWSRLLHLGPNRIALRCDNQADAINWLAIEPGVHTIDGKRVEAGIATGAVSGGNISFPTAFPAPPVVLLSIDESVDNAGAGYTRVIGTVTTSGFQYYVDANADALHWIAMEPGTYSYGRYRWTAGVVTANNTCTNPCTFNLPSTLSTVPEILLTINDTDNNGAVWARLLKVTPSQFQFRMNTSTENVFYVLLEDLN